MEEKKEQVTEQEKADQPSAQKKETKTTAKKKTGSKRKPAKEDQLKSELDETRQQLEDVREKYLRLSAEYDNYRKRTLREKMELTKTGGEKVLLHILPVVDNLDRAMASAQEARDVEAVKTGLELIINKFLEFLEQNGVKEIPALQADFDTDLHEAITKIPAENEEMKGKIVDVIEKGYYLHDKVLRYAKVVVGE